MDDANKDSTYFATGYEAGPEAERLALLCDVYGPGTYRRLAERGLKEGFSCWEVGAGTGDVARHMADIVGPQGRVVASDLRGDYFDRAGYSNLTFHTHDVLSGPIEANAFDLVHCRALLMHLPGAREAFHNMVAALKPGGTVLIEEFDFAGAGAADFRSEIGREYDRLNDKLRVLVREVSAAMERGGRIVPVLMEGVTLESVGSEQDVQIWHGGGKGARLDCLSAIGLLDSLPNGGDFSPEDRASLKEIYENPDFTYVSTTVFSAWGKKPLSPAH